MRVLLTTDTVGGVWTFTQQLCASLCGGNHVALVSFGRAPSAEQEAWLRGMRTVQCGFFDFWASDAPLEWMPGNAATFDSGTALLSRIAEDWKPDLLHSNQFCWGALGQQLELPTVITAHSDVLSWAAACRPEGLADSPWLQEYRRLVQAGLHGAEAVAAPTRWMLEALGQNFELPARQSVIQNGSSALSAVAQPTQPKRKLQAVTAGRLWDEGKNLAMLQDVDFPMPLLIAGEATFGEAATALPETAQALGQLTHADFLLLCRESAIYVCSSRYEPFGLAPLEAALCGCALLLHDIPPLQEVWGAAALYFDSPGSLEALLVWLTADGIALERAQKLVGARAAQLTTHRMAAGYTALYNEVITTHPTPAGQVAAHAF